jgi:hypothetical protein
MSSLPPQTHVTVSRTGLARKLAFGLLALSGAHLVVEWARTQMGITGGMGLVKLFALEEEANLPTFFSTLQLLLASVLLWWVSLISKQRGNHYSRHWQGLALVFLYLAADESAQLHELSILPVLHLIKGHATGLLYWPWVIPGMIAVATLGIIYLKWFFALDSAVRRIFAIAAALYVGGAIGFEMIGAYHVEREGYDNFTYSVLVLFEEGCEMGGVLVLIHGLLTYIQSMGGPLRLTITSAGARSS